MTADFSIWLGLALCLALSFMLSGMEAGVLALSRLRIRRLMRSGRSSARTLHGFLENPENFLWTILVGNTIVNFIILGLIVVLLHRHWQGQIVIFAITYAVIVFLFYALFDLLPKMLFRTFPNRLCMFFAKPFRLVHLVLRPIVVLLEWSSAILLRWTNAKAFTGRLFGNREELRLVMQESAQSLTSEERAMINHVLDLQTLRVSEVMKPLAEVVMLDGQTPTREALALAQERGVPRFPVLEMRDGQQRVTGIVVVDNILYREVLDRDKPVAEHVQPAVFLDEDMRLEVALQRLQRSGQRLAVVLGRDGREAGVVGMEDILKTVFGEVKL